MAIPDELVDSGKTIRGKFFSVFNQESNLQLDPVFCDLALIVQLDLLILDPGGLEILERFMSARNADYDCIIKTFGG
jgi:hypothetical protein